MFHEFEAVVAVFAGPDDFSFDQDAVVLKIHAVLGQSQDLADPDRHAEHQDNEFGTDVLTL